MSFQHCLKFIINITDRVMRDKVFIVIGILSLIVMGLELLGTIPETYGWIAFLGWMMFIFNAVNTSRQKNK